MILRWPGKAHPRARSENGIVSGLDWFPTLVAAAGYQGDIATDLKEGQAARRSHPTRSTSMATTRWT